MEVQSLITLHLSLINTASVVETYLKNDDDECYVIIL